jgi:hypothetical protein
MAISIEESILRHVRDKSSASLRNLYESLLDGTMLVRLFSEITTDTSGKNDLPVNYFRLADGLGCLPAYTSLARFLEWNEVGSRYTELQGRKLFRMVTDMPEIDCIYVNYSAEQGTPKGKIGRREFELLGKGIFPERPVP